MDAQTGPIQTRSLLAHAVIWVVIPFSLLTVILILTSVVLYQQAVTALVVNRDSQLATLTASSVSEGLEGYARVLEALAGNADVNSNSDTMRQDVIDSAGGALAIFNAGVAIVDADGAVRTAAPTSVTLNLPTIADQDYFQSIRSRRVPEFSGVLTSPVSGEPLIIVAVPVVTDDDRFAGALLGVVLLRTSSLGGLVKNLIVGNNGSAYLVGQRGKLIYHRDSDRIGMDYSNRPPVLEVMAGRSGGMVWQTAAGERIVEGYAPIPLAGWGLIVQESWDLAVAPTQAHFLLLALVALGIALIAVAVLWRGVRQITAPVQRIAEQTSRLAAEDPVEPVHESQIAEVGALGRAFNHMAAQIITYRAGLRRYVGAITNSQEEERRRISRDLHDETVQSLMAIGRRLELYQSSEQDPARLAQFQELHGMIEDTVRGLRQISQDLRPLILDDLGLVPAMRTLVRGVREGTGALPLATLEVVGAPTPLSPEYELAIYRITQESLTNVRKHARATGVEVTLTYKAHAVELEVTDDGEGFSLPPSLAELAQQGSFGLMGMQERMWAVGGTLTIDSRPDHGTRIAASIPLAPT